MASILVVDDYIVTQRVLSTQLRKGGHDVATATSAAEALLYLKDTHCDLAIVDVAMPDMDGITLLKILRKDGQHETLPIIILTASVLDDDRLRAKAAGATDFLTKPISSWELLEIVDRQLNVEQQPFPAQSRHTAMLQDLMQKSV